MQKSKIKKVLPAIAVGVVLFVGWFLWTIIANDQPQFFPLNNSNARYTIVKSSKLGQGWVEKVATNSTELPAPRYYVEYRGDGVFADDQNKHFFRVTVGNSKVDLEPFIGKDVLVTKGKFVNSSKQCIAGKCIDIYGPFVVLDIGGLEVIK